MDVGGNDDIDGIDMKMAMRLEKLQLYKIHCMRDLHFQENARTKTLQRPRLQSTFG
jgi:hypothetical protein